MDLQKKSVLLFISLLMGFMIAIDILSPEIPYIIITLTSGLILGLGVIVLMDREVLKRIDLIVSQIHDIGTPGSTRRHVGIRGDDELAGLAFGINQMLDTIEAMHREMGASEARFRELAERLPQIIFEIDVEANLRYANRYAMDQFGLSDDTIRSGFNVRRLIAPEDTDRVDRNMQRVAAGEKPPGETYTLIRKDGSPMKTILISAPIIRNGRLEGFRGSGIDITDRVRLEEALAESERYLQMLVASIRAGIVVIDAETHTVVDANPAALDLMGTTREAVIGKPCRAVLCPSEDKRCPITDLHRTVDNTECVMLTASGCEIPIIKYVLPVTLRGRPCLLETFIDNSGRKQIERDLAESEEKYRALTENTDDVLYSMDLEGIITYVSPQVNKYGFLEEELIGRQFRTIIHPEDRRRVEEDYLRDLGSGAKFYSSFRIADKWGIVHWMDARSTLRLDESANPVGIYGVLRDATEQKEAEEELIGLKNLYMAIFDNTGSATIIVASDTTIVLANQKWADIAGVTKKESIGMSWVAFIHPDDVGTMKEFHRQRRTDPANVPREYTFRLVDTSHNIHHCLASVVMIPGTTDSIAAIADVSEMKRIESAVELANRKLNLMNNITRHDILNTVTGLIGCVDMAQDTPSSDEKTSLLNDIRDLTRVIQRQIAFTKEYQEVGVRLPVWQNAHGVIVRILPNFRSGVRIIPDLEDVEIYADPLLEKVFYNLVDNAIRYGQTISTVTFGYLMAEEDLVIVCIDDGVGVETEDKERIFERGVGKNTGMGLFLTREILAITGITIAETGIPGEGARFEIRIPRGMYRFSRQMATERENDAAVMEPGYARRKVQDGHPFDTHCRG